MSGEPLSDLVQRLRDADRDSVQRSLGSRIFGEAADRIETLEARNRELEADSFEKAHDAAKLERERDEAETAVSRYENTVVRLERQIVDLEARLRDYEEVQEDKRRICREMDVAMFGKDAAKQPSLCDIQASVIDLVARLRRSEADAGRYRWIRLAGAWQTESWMDDLSADPRKFDAAVDEEIALAEKKAREP